MAVAHCSLLADRCYTVMTATSQGGSHIATVGSTAWCRLARERTCPAAGRGRGVGVDWALHLAKCMPTCLSGSILRLSSTGDIAVLFADGCVMETMPALKKMSMSVRPTQHHM